MLSLPLSLQKRANLQALDLAEDEGAAQRRHGDGEAEGGGRQRLSGNLDDGVVGYDGHDGEGGGNAREGGALEDRGREVQSKCEEGKGLGGEVDHGGKEGENIRTGGLGEHQHLVQDALLGGGEDQRLELGKGDAGGGGLGEETGLRDLGEELGGLGALEKVLDGDVVAGGVHLGGDGGAGVLYREYPWEPSTWRIRKKSDPPRPRRPPLSDGANTRPRIPSAGQ